MGTELITLESVLWPMFAGIIGASVIILFYKKLFGKLVGKLIDMGAATPETAVTLEEAGIKPNALLLRALSGKGSLGRYVLSLPANAVKVPASETEHPAAEEKGCTLRYYLPEENQDRVSLQYNNDGASVLCVFLAFILFFVATFLLIKIIPSIVDMLKKFIESL